MKIFQSCNSFTFMVANPDLSVTSKRNGKIEVVKYNTLRTLLIMELVNKVAEVK